MQATEQEQEQALQKIRCANCTWYVRMEERRKMLFIVQRAIAIANAFQTARRRSRALRVTAQ